MIANSVMRAAGYPAFTRNIAPQKSCGSLDGLQLGAAGLFETFCNKRGGRFDIQDASGRPLTNQLNLSPQDKRTIFESFFDMSRVERICGAHGLGFRERITFVDQWTVRLTGRVIDHGASRSGYPVVSAYDERKKTSRANANPWVDKYVASGLNVQQDGQGG
ncbi:hypothetical protein B0O80DRAFT_474073 [Mortierella sp. GBAus27b]|nr:hypothetical protein B0O80DRAFT_474073 [Mortierella sp. GBAus27b]